MPKRPRKPAPLSFRIAALCLPFLLLVLAEGAMRLLGYPSRWDVPLLPQNRLELVRATRLPTHHIKPGDFVIVGVGESTMEGVPYQRLHLPGMLEVLLREQNPGRGIHVVNLGTRSEAAAYYSRVPRHFPDLNPKIILAYGGHNERILGNALWSELLADPSWRGKVQRAFFRSVLFTELWTAIRDFRASLLTPVDLGHLDVYLAKGELPYLREQWFKRFVELDHWSREHDARLVVMSPASTDRLPPRHLDRETSHLLARFQEAAVLSSPDLNLLLTEIAVGPALEHPALLEYAHGLRAEVLGDAAEARARYAAAKKSDNVPNRMPHDWTPYLHAQAERQRILVFPAYEILAGASPGGILKQEFFCDTMHFSPEALHLLTVELAHWLGKVGLLGDLRFERNQARSLGWCLAQLQFSPVEVLAHHLSLAHSSSVGPGTFEPARYLDHWYYWEQVLRWMPSAEAALDVPEWAYTDAERTQIREVLQQLNSDGPESPEVVLRWAEQLKQVERERWQRGRPTGGT